MWQNLSPGRISRALYILWINVANPKSADDVEIIYEKSLIGTVAEARLPPKYATGLSDPYAEFEDISPALLKKIQKLFEADFDLFSYSPLKAVEKASCKSSESFAKPKRKIGRKIQGAGGRTFCGHKMYTEYFSFAALVVRK